MSQARELMELAQKQGKPLYKSELALLLGVSTRTLCRWMNFVYFEKLEKEGYDRNQKIVLPSQYAIFFEK